MTFELTRMVPVARIGAGLTFEVVADAAEREAVARRMGLVAVARLGCRFVLRPEPAGAFAARGALRAQVVQTCVVSTDPFDAVVEEDFEVRFVPAGTENDDIDLDAADEIPYERDTLDLGEATAEQLALALDPFPRKPDVTLPKLDDDEDNGPLAALKKLRSSSA